MLENSRSEAESLLIRNSCCFLASSRKSFLQSNCCCHTYLLPEFSSSEGGCVTSPRWIDFPHSDHLFRSIPLRIFLNFVNCVKFLLKFWFSVISHRTFSQWEHLCQVNRNSIVRLGTLMYYNVSTRLGSVKYRFDHHYADSEI